MKKIESIYDSEKFGKNELRKIKGGIKVSNSNEATNTPRRISNCGGLTIRNLDTDSDS